MLNKKFLYGLRNALYNNMLIGESLDEVLTKIDQQPNSFSKKF